MSEFERPIVLLDLNDACHSLAMLLFCANEFVPEEEWGALADAIRPHLQAAAEVIASALPPGNLNTE